MTTDHTYVQKMYKNIFKAGYRYVNHTCLVTFRNLEKKTCSTAVLSEARQ